MSGSQIVTSNASVDVPDGVVFVAADEPLLVFRSVGEAESWLEAIDVENEEYPAAYGPTGEPFRVTSEGNRVIVEPTGEPIRPDELKALLLRHLQAIGRSADGSAPLNELVASAWAIQAEGQRRLGNRVVGGCFIATSLIVAALYLALR